MYFKTKIKVYVKSGSWFLKMEDIEQQIDGIISNCWREFVTELRKYQVRRKQKMDVSSKKKERYCRSILFDQNDLSLTDKKDLRKHQRMNILAAIPILLFYLNKN